MPSFDWDDLTRRCVEACGEPDPLGAVAEALARAVADHARLGSSVQIPLDADDDGVVHRSDALLIVNVIFPAGFRTGIHDHRIPAVIGAWGGHEDNRLFRRAQRGIEPAGVRRLEPGDVLVLDEHAIHDVHAPAGTWSGAVHVYLGDLGTVARSSWPSGNAPEAVFDADEMECRWLERATATGLVRGTDPAGRG